MGTAAWQERFMATKHRTKFYMVRQWVKEAYDSPPMQEPASPPRHL